MTHENNCCSGASTKRTENKTRAVTLVSAFFAAGLAGVSCLGCLPLIGVAIASSSIAAILDGHLLALQLSLIAISILFSGIYLRRAKPRLTSLVGASSAYLILIGNALTLQNKPLAGFAALVLVGSHLRNGKKQNPNRKLQLLYFEGCPNLPTLISVLNDEGITKFEKIDLEKLPENHPLRSFSSPTLLSDGKPVVGTETSNHSLSCSFITKTEMLARIRRSFQSE